LLKAALQRIAVAKIVAPGKDSLHEKADHRRSGVHAPPLEIKNMKFKHTFRLDKLEIALTFIY
jgi:hypothetical protein